MRTLRQVIARKPDHALAHYNLALLLKRVDRVDEAIAVGAARGGHRRPVRSPPRARQPLRPAGGLRAGRGVARGRDRRRSTLGGRLGAPRRGAEGARRSAAGRRRAAPGDRAPPRVVDGARGAGHRPRAGRRRRWQPARLRRGRATPHGGSARADRRRHDGGRREPARLRGTPTARANASRRPSPSRRRYAPAYYHLGRALHRLGRIDDARAAFAKAQQLNPSLVSPLGDR